MVIYTKVKFSKNNHEVEQEVYLSFDYNRVYMVGNWRV